jgi:hypothetical protein
MCVMIHMYVHVYICYFSMIMISLLDSEMKGLSVLVHLFKQ